MVEKLQPVLFTSAGSHPVQLEGMLHLPAGEGPWPAAVICHPHPLGGGTMHNPVVTAVTRALVARGILALRFNFRGVGRSDGQHDGGRGEQSDVAGALDWLLSLPQVDPWHVAVVGYSFGAWVGLSQAQTDPRVSAVAAVGLVAWHHDADFYQATARSGRDLEAWQFAPDFLRDFGRPKLFVSGDRDPFAPAPLLRSLVARLPPPKELHLLPGADHFFGGQEQQVGQLVAGFLADL